MKSIFLIADYGSDDLATTEVVSALRNLLSEPVFIERVAARAFNTLNTGFLLEQLERGLSSDQASQAVFFLNTDPRTHTKDVAAKAEGSGLYAAVLESGATVISPNAGYCLSFIKEKIEKLSVVNLPAAGTQFRSRDIFPHAVVPAVEGRLEEVLGTEVSLDLIPDLPKGFFVLHNDNYGNIKTSYTKRDLEEARYSEGDIIRVLIGSKEYEACIASTIFTIPPGNLVCAPGSSGDPQNPYIETSLRYNGNPKESAAVLFDWPEPGTTVIINKR